MMPDITLFDPSHWEAVREIYSLGMATGNATFETVVPSLTDFQNKFHPHLLWVARHNNVVVGWAGLQPVSAREVYRGVAEVTVYVHPSHGGTGIGTALMNHLVFQSEAAGIWTLYASIFSENKASRKLHLTTGFREVGYREKIAQRDGHWRNTILYERRSKIAGI